MARNYTPQGIEGLSARFSTLRVRSSYNKGNLRNGLLTLTTDELASRRKRKSGDGESSEAIALKAKRSQSIFSLTAKSSADVDYWSHKWGVGGKS
ncbi:MAG: hypothetical protein RMZ42_03475 [Nostoc sp. DedQUE05]|uniref:hypothetical protein n=1 Tax=Nostoc sp. DedQUE05 TaxID=3075391 RepID=UPI002AD38908|nr:hypothetical protein [Nostoc sp. DedQUE05]MDZ8090991.1 hypothetical protein [Nostoc sp. DedQUE05]